MAAGSNTAPYPGFDPSGHYHTPRRAPRVRPEASDFADRNAGSINLFDDKKHTHVIGPPPSPRCLTSEAKQNYQNSRNGHMGGLLGGGSGEGMPESDSAPVARVKPEAQTIADYHRGGNMSQLITNTRQGPQLSARQARVKVEAADNATLDKGQRMSSLLHDPTAMPATPKPLPRVKVEAGEAAELGTGTQMAQVMFEYGSTPRSGRPAPRVKREASDNASLDQGGQMQNLFLSYGRQPTSARPAPRVRDGQDMARLDQGGRLARLMQEGERLPTAVKPAPRAPSAAGRRNVRRGKHSSLSQVFADTSKWHVVPTPGVRKAKA